MNDISPLTTSLNQNQAATAMPESEMGQQDFIQLMLAQMKNQDPTKPLDPNQFMSQLAEFSTVNGIQELQESFETLAANISSDQTLQAANLVGRSVLVPGDGGTLVEGEGLSGEALLPVSSSDVNVKIYDQSGALVRTMPLGGKAAGAVHFKWDGFKDDGSAALPGDYRVEVEAAIEGETQGLHLAMQTRVDSVTLNPYGGALLNLANGNAVSIADIYQFM